MSEINKIEDSKLKSTIVYKASRLLGDARSITFSSTRPLFDYSFWNMLIEHIDYDVCKGDDGSTDSYYAEFLIDEEEYEIYIKLVRDENNDRTIFISHTKKCFEYNKVGKLTDVILSRQLTRIFDELMKDSKSKDVDERRTVTKDGLDVRINNIDLLYDKMHWFCADNSEFEYYFWIGEVQDFSEFIVKASRNTLDKKWEFSINKHSSTDYNCNSIYLHIINEPTYFAFFDLTPFFTEKPFLIEHIL